MQSKQEPATCSKLKDLEKARILADRQSQTSISASELDEPRCIELSKFYCDQNKFDVTIKSAQKPE